LTLHFLLLMYVVLFLYPEHQVKNVFILRVLGSGGLWQMNFFLTAQDHSLNDGVL